jgi:UDP-galactopyranose mutase
MFGKILENPLIEVRTGVDFRELKDHWQDLADHLIYTGPIDEYFDFRFG